MEQDVLTNQIQRWSEEYDGWFRTGTEPDASDSNQQIAASRMEICESNRGRIEADLSSSINEVSIIQAAIGIKEQESKGNKSSILNSILNLVFVPKLSLPPWIKFGWNRMASPAFKLGL